MLYILHWIYLINAVYICLISSLCSLLEQFLSHFLVLPRASDFCSLFVSLPKEMNLFYPELIYLPSARNWTQLLRVIGSTLRTFHKSEKVWTNSQKRKGYIQGYHWRNLLLRIPLPSPQTVLPLYSTSPITLKSNLNEVRSWNVVEIATKCEIKQPARLLLSLSLKHLKLPSVWKSNFKSFLVYVVGIIVKFR